MYRLFFLVITLGFLTTCGRVSLKRLSTEIKRIEDTKGVIKRYQVDDISMNILDAYQGDNILYSGLKVLQGTISTHAKKV
jgi:hypothetical protein